MINYYIDSELGRSLIRFADKLFEHKPKSFTHIEDSYHDGRISIQDIFIDNWEEFLKCEDVQRHGIRDVVLKEVDRMMSCGTPDCGYEVWECPACHSYHVICYTCKSRFCSRCGVKYAKARAFSIAENTMNVNHRHMVFTIDKRLRIYFQYDRYMLNLLFTAAYNSIQYAFSKKLDEVPGVIITLHTFGRALNWNPHVHCLVTEGSMKGRQLFKNKDYLHYAVLRKSFQAQLIKLMREYIKEHHPYLKIKFKDISDEIYKENKNGFYVYAPKVKKKNKQGKKCVINYIVRYTGRPVMASSRIISYDKDTKMISYWFEDHESHEYVQVNEHVFEFMKKLIIHIPETQFKMVRYYGLYATCDHKHKAKVKLHILKHGQRWYDRPKCYRQDLIETYGVDPFLCTCGTMMKFAGYNLRTIKGDDLDCY